MSKPQIFWWVIYSKEDLSVYTDQGWVSIYSRAVNPSLYQNKSDAEDLLEQWKSESEDEEELESFNSCIIVPGVFAFPT